MKTMKPKNCGTMYHIPCCASTMPVSDIVCAVITTPISAIPCGTS